MEHVCTYILHGSAALITILELGVAWARQVGGGGEGASSRDVTSCCYMALVETGRSISYHPGTRYKNIPNFPPPQISTSPAIELLHTSLTAPSGRQIKCLSVGSSLLRSTPDNIIMSAVALCPHVVSTFCN